VAASFGLLLATPLASAESVGHDLYLTYCAACHGLEAEGNGPVADALIVRPPNLTNLTRRFGMPLPRDKVAEYIDGRRDVRAHGSREMPVWGERFQEDLVGLPATEDTTRRIIESIVDYLISIQQIRGAAR
jgi:mono/diheme cytochrome c family protein